MSGYISGAALTVILVPSFHQNDVCVCVGVCVCEQPPHLVPPQSAEHMQAIVHSDSKHSTHLYAFIRDQFQVGLICSTDMSLIRDVTLSLNSPNTFNSHTTWGLVLRPVLLFK